MSPNTANLHDFVRVLVRNALFYQARHLAAAGVQHFLMLVSGQYEVSPNTVNLHDFVRVHQLPA